MTNDSGAVSRRLFTAGIGASGLLALAPLSALTASASTTGGAATPAQADRWARRAKTGYEALQRYLYQPKKKLYAESHPTADGENPYAYAWPMREAAAATQDLNELTGGRRYEDDVVDRFTGIEKYFDAERGGYPSYPPEPLGTGGDLFFDDNGVIGLEYLRRYRFTGNAKMLRRAARAFDFVEQAWDTESTGKRAGGMHWVDASWNPYQGATNVTSIAAQLAAHLYEETGEKRYLRWAERTYGWVHRQMRSGSGLYANALKLDGTVEETLWTYNSGFMIGAATVLHRCTHDKAWLGKADADARGALDYWGYGSRLYDQPAVFNAIFLANLLLFASQRPNDTQRVVKLFSRYAERLWDDNRDTDTGLFTFQASGGGAPDAEQRPQTLHQSAVVQIFALLGWSKKTYPDAT